MSLQSPTRFSSLLALGLSLAAITPSFAQTTSDAADTEARFPGISVTNRFAPPGESNVRSSFQVSDGVAIIGTEETGDIYKTQDAGQSWRKVIDTDELWEISDVRNFIRAQDNAIYATTSEPATILRSTDDGENWELLAKPEASRTVGLVQLDGGAILAGLRRSENNKISIIRSEDGFETYNTVVLSEELPRQNTTCLFDLGDGVVLCGVGYEASGKIFKSTDAGLTWKQTADFPDARDMMNFYREGDKVYAMCSGVSKLFVSDDAGDTWSTATQIWEKGFLGQSISFEHGGKTFRVLAGTDQRIKKQPRHVLLISDDASQSWHEWIELAVDTSGGASNLAQLNANTLVVGTGNHSVQGYVYTLTLE